MSDCIIMEIDVLEREIERQIKQSSLWSLDGGIPEYLISPFVIVLLAPPSDSVLYYSLPRNVLHY